MLPQVQSKVAPGVAKVFSYLQTIDAEDQQPGRADPEQELKRKQQTACAPRACEDPGMSFPTKWTFKMRTERK